MNDTVIASQGCRPKSNSTKTNTIIHREQIFRIFAFKNSDHVSAVAYVQSEYCDSIYWRYEIYRYVRYAGTSVNMATQIWKRMCVGWVLSKKKRQTVVCQGIR